MLEQPRDEGVGLLAQAALVGGIGEGVLAILEQAHVGVHAAAVDAEHRLGHERGVQAVLLCQRLDSQLEGHDVIGGVQGVGVLEVDLMLAGGDLVVGRLDLKAHLLKRHADLPAGVLAVVERTQVKVGGLVGRRGSRRALLVRLEQEGLALRADVERIAHCLRALELPLQNPARVSDAGDAVRIVYVAEQARHLDALRQPGQDCEGIQIGIQVLVALLNAGEAFDGTAVDHDLVVHGLFDLADGDRDILQLSEDVGELHADVLHIALLDHADDVFPAVLTHDCNLPEK